MTRLGRMGVQRRIMTYVTAGLVVMFGLLIALGLGALDKATQLVFQARLSTAESLALTLERDLIHITSDVRGSATELTPGEEGPVLDRRVAGVIEHLTRYDSFAFFDADGIMVFDLDGRLLSSAGEPFTVEPSPRGVAGGDYDFQMLGPAGGTPEAPGFGSVGTRLGSGHESVVVVVHLSGHNSPLSFIPEDYVRAGIREGDGSYHLEVIGPDGDVVLAIGGAETPGQTSPHYRAILDRGDGDDPEILRHVGADGSGEADHVMGVVPLSDLGLTLVLEQPIDVALELPLQVRRRLITWSVAGFVASLAVAWVTTRAVVAPARQLTLAAERIAGGDLDTPVRVTARDEFGVLAERFEAMRRQISSAYDAVEQANEELERRVKERTARLGILLNRVISAQEDERQRLARELHDETAQTLGALSISLARACDDHHPGSGIALDQLVKSREMVSRLLEDTRRLILDLRPMLLDDLGLIPAIRWYADSRLGDADIDTEFEIEALSERLPPHIETALFRIVQEAMNNVVKHSGADHVRIHLSSRDHVVRMIVSDDGGGFDVNRVVGGLDEHVGLAGMRERVSLLGGEMSIRSTPGRGTTVSIVVPFTEVHT